MLLRSLPPSASCRFRARNCARAARTVLRPPCGVLTNNSNKAGSNQSFVKLHEEVLQDSEWYGPEAPDHTVSPATVAAAPAAAATRGDVRLMAGFTKFLKNHKLDLSALFCAEAVLSADSRVVCNTAEGHHTELLSEYLTSGGLRVGEELPHWFVNGNLRGAIKCWMATRPAAATLNAAAAAGGGGSAVLTDSAELQQRRQQLAASVSEQGPVGAAASSLVDHLLAAMPGWRPGSVGELAGWEPAAGELATAEDVSLLHAFGAIVYGSRLDVAVFLQQLCGADPFSWVMAQVAQGVISEPEPWLLEQYFMSRHTVGEALPPWFSKWGVRQEISRWLQDPKAAELVQALLETRGGGGVPTANPAAAADANADAAADRGSAAADASSGAAASTDPRVTLSTALAHLEGSAAGLLVAALSRRGIMPSRSVVEATLSCRRDVRLYDSSDPDAAHSVDLLANCSALNAALVAVAVQVPADANVAAVVRQAKERLDWLGFLLGHVEGGAGGGLKAQVAVAKVLLVVPEEGVTLPGSVTEYLRQAHVFCVLASELPYAKDA